MTEPKLEEFSAIKLMDAMESIKGNLLVWHEKIGDSQWRLRVEHGPRQSYVEWENAFLHWNPDTKIRHYLNGYYLPMWVFRLRLFWA